MVLAIVGEAGVGKTSSASFFQSKGAFLISADLIVKYLYQLPEIKKEVVEKCGQKFLNPDDTINRLALRKYAFENYQFLTKLEEITWPKMKKIIVHEIETHKSEKLIVLDCAVLFNANLDYLADKVLLIEADEVLKIKRVKERDKVNDDEAKTLLNLQKEHLILHKRNDFVVQNNGTTEEFIAQLEEIWIKLVN